ncbi:hypothetical protein FRX31_018478 [Thalictrum thalictroides]|uniref:Uncharacterized protein n=1 Tax=Thalictrum thalictroides TaxID=46969 RepID=A0A7J6W3I5_THATH|nr:hypothetical protein FRX31_018478 [Thalictrum thalictroides]
MTKPWQGGQCHIVAGQGDLNGPFMEAAAITDSKGDQEGGTSGRPAAGQEGSSGKVSPATGHVVPGQLGSNT